MEQVVKFNPASPDYKGMKYEMEHFWGKDADPKMIDGLNNRINLDLNILLPAGP
jgi:hypothetical protein